MPSVSNERIRVLIVDDIPETRENLRKLLYFEKDIEVVGVGVNGEQAVALAKELQPHVILMDINMPGMDGIAASEAISAFLSGAQIIMMSVQGETDYLRRSMLAGAKGFLIKPFSSDEMVTTIRRVYGLRPKVAPVQTPEYQTAPSTTPGKLKREGRGQILALFSAKGGAGRSLLATNLAIALRGSTEKRVILVDCSLQFGDVGVLMNLTSSQDGRRSAGCVAHAPCIRHQDALGSSSSRAGRAFERRAHSRIARGAAKDVRLYRCGYGLFSAGPILDHL
jgi:pilus assembly protein CpaE